MEANQRKKICFLPNRLMLGGIEMVLADAVNILHEKYDIEIVIFRDEQCDVILNRIPQDVKITLKPLPKSRVLKRLSTIPYLSGLYFRKALGKDRYDYLITLRPSMIQACFTNVAKHKIYWSHTDYYKNYISSDSFKAKMQKHLFKLVYGHHDMVWNVSETICEDIKNATKLKNVYALPNPVNCSEIIEKANKKCDLIFDASKTNIVMIGRLSKEKGFHRVINFMCKDVFQKYPDTHLYIIGPGNTDAYRKYISTTDHSDKITVLGAKENPFPYLNQAQLLICPSIDESFGLVMLEAMLLKVPVITTDTVGGRYLTQNNTLGCCVKNNEASIQAAVENFLGDRNHYHYSLDDAQQWAKQHDIKCFEEKILKLLAECNC